MQSWVPQLLLLLHGGEPGGRGDRWVVGQVGVGGGAFPGGSPGGGWQVETDQLSCGCSVAVVDRGRC